MTFYIVGLGNPGEVYAGTRHNTGRIVIEHFRRQHEFPEWKEEARHNALISRGCIERKDVVLISPLSFMNESGKSIRSFVTSQQRAENVILIHDDIDLPFGTFKVSFNRGSGGHKGVASVIQHLRTTAFIRIRVGVCPIGENGTCKKPDEDNETVAEFLLQPFTREERTVLRSSVCDDASRALLQIIRDGYEKAASVYN